MLAAIINFVLDIWLWNMTWGWYQVALSLIFMCIFTIFIGHMKSGIALLFVLGSYVVSFIVYSLFVVGILIYCLRWEWVTDAISTYMPVNVLLMSFYLGALYTLLQSFFFIILRKRYTINFLKTVLITIMSNSLAALLATYFIHALDITP